MQRRTALLALTLFGCQTTTVNEAPEDRVTGGAATGGTVSGGSGGGLGAVGGAGRSSPAGSGAAGNSAVSGSVVAGNGGAPISINGGASGEVGGAAGTSGVAVVPGGAGGAAGNPTVAGAGTGGQVTSVLAITTAALPNAGFNTAYEYKLTAEGSAVYSWSVASGALPPGLKLSADGVISGTPTAAANASVKIAVRGSDGVEITKDFSLSVSRKRWLAYESDDELLGTDRLFAADVTTGSFARVKLLTDEALGGGIQDFRFSPDGSRFLALATDSTTSKRGLYLVDFSGTLPRAALRLGTDSAGPVMGFDWSPDSKRILFWVSLADADTYELYWMDLSTETPSAPRLVSRILSRINCRTWVTDRLITWFNDGALYYARMGDTDFQTAQSVSGVAIGEGGGCWVPRVGEELVVTNDRFTNSSVDITTGTAYASFSRNMSVSLDARFGSTVGDSALNIYRLSDLELLTPWITFLTPPSFGGRWWWAPQGPAGVMVDANYKLSFVTLDSSNPTPRPFADGTTVGSLAINKDSTWAVFDTIDGKSLYASRINGTTSAEPVRVSGPLAGADDYVSRFYLSPNGKGLVYTAPQITSGVHDLFFVDLSGAAPTLARKLNPDQEQGGYPLTVDKDSILWSPDSSSVSYTTLNSKDYVSGQVRNLFLADTVGAGQARSVLTRSQYCDVTTTATTCQAVKRVKFQP